MKSAEAESKIGGAERTQLTNTTLSLDGDEVLQVTNTDINSSVLRANKLQFVGCVLSDVNVTGKEVELKGTTVRNSTITADMLVIHSGVLFIGSNLCVQNIRGSALSLSGNAQGFFLGLASESGSSSTASSSSTSRACP
ncbi:MAG: hypothetical protein A2W47_07305 [Gammaproteobacteria bacterium RIFCSPHIGHO2_12_38_15]|nr:MAG: hypothetical protein A2W47_07305 [Gammaproteobacteria bacterium RIFCSPHIGHO2_12_38_15]